MGDRIAVMSKGELQQIGTPEELYTQPANTFVATFIGSPAMNMLPSAVLGVGGTGQLAGFRPEHVRLGNGRPGSGSLEASVEVVEYLGDEQLAHLRLGDHEIVVEAAGRAAAASAGSSETFSVPLDKVMLFDEESSQALGTAALAVVADGSRRVDVLRLRRARRRRRHSPLRPGFFASDTRFLSRSVLTLGGARLEPLSHDHPAPHLASFVLRNPLVDGLRAERARRSSGSASSATAWRSGSSSRTTATAASRSSSALELEADFADIFVVKALEPGFGSAGDVDAAAAAPARAGTATGTLVFADDGVPGADGRPSLASPSTSRAASRGSRSRSSRASAGGSSSASSRSSSGVRAAAGASFARELEEERTPGRASRMRATGALGAAAARTLGRPRPHVEPVGRRPRVAAHARAEVPTSARCSPPGTPWFMTVFGRDTLISSPADAHVRPRARSERRCASSRRRRRRDDDPERDAEPGKIIHELRRGKARARLDRPLLRDGRRDAALPHPALGALALDRRPRARARARGRGAARARVDRRPGGPRRRRLRRVRPAQLARDPQPDLEGLGGLDGVSRRHARAAADRRRSRCRATSTTRSCASPRSRARSGGTTALAERLERDAAELQRRFDEAFWLRGPRLLRARPRPREASDRLARRRTSAICCGAASSRSRAATQSPTR